MNETKNPDPGISFLGNSWSLNGDGVAEKLGKTDSKFWRGSQFEIMEYLCKCGRGNS